MNVSKWPWPTIALVVVILGVGAKLYSVSQHAHDMDEKYAVVHARAESAEQILAARKVVDRTDSLQRVREQSIIDSLGGVIAFQAKSIDRWKTAKTVLIPVDTSLALEVQLENCQDNVATLIRHGDDLVVSLMLTKVAADSAIAVATNANLRADSADTRRALASDSVSQMLKDIKKATTRRWYQKLWGGTVDVVTTTAKVGVGIVIGKIL